MLFFSDDNYQPKQLKKKQRHMLRSIAFNTHKQCIYTGGDEKKLALHCLETGEMFKEIDTEGPINNISVNSSNHNIFVIASTDVSIYDIRQSSTTYVTIAERENQPHNSVSYSPRDDHLLLVSSPYTGMELYDIRYPSTYLFTYYSPSLIQFQESDYSCFNQKGDLIFMLAYDSLPLLYNVNSPYPLAEFDDPLYHHSVTSKSCSFIGQKDQYVVAGSDNFEVNIWKIPENLQTSLNNKNNPNENYQMERVYSSQFNLKGHR